MTAPNPALERLIRSARRGDQEALGKLFERHKTWLLLLATMGLNPDIRPRVGDSDLVQQTLLSALKAFPEFKGTSTREFQVWLKRIFDRNLVDTYRFHRADKRKLSRGRSLEPLMGNGDADLQTKEPSPSDRIQLDELSVELVEAIEVLPADQREAVRMRFLEGKSLRQLQQHFDRSVQVCAGLVRRGLSNLHSRLSRKAKE